MMLHGSLIGDEFFFRRQLNVDVARAEVGADALNISHTRGWVLKVTLYTSKVAVYPRRLDSVCVHLKMWSWFCLGKLCCNFCVVLRNLLIVADVSTAVLR